MATKTKTAKKRPTAKRTPAKKKTTRAKHRGAESNGWKEDLRKEVVNASKPLSIEITQAHINKAKCKDPSKCVIAQALADAPFVGDVCEGFAIGSNVTKLVMGDKIVRFTTPSRLRASLKVFDITGLWPLPPGTYTLHPYKGAQTRWDSAKRQGGKQDTFYNERSAPTRRSPSLATLRKAA